jgi:hypothetical protein
MVYVVSYKLTGFFIIYHFSDLYPKKFIWILIKYISKIKLKIINFCALAFAAYFFHFSKPSCTCSSCFRLETKRQPSVHVAAQPLHAQRKKTKIKELLLSYKYKLLHPKYQI